jgi:hypothetical protein
LKRARAGWRERVLADPYALATRVGAVVPFHVPAVEVALVAFGGSAPLSFDVNTATEGVMRCIPGIAEEDVARWLAERTARPFVDADDFRARVVALAKDPAFKDALKPGIPT